MLERGWLGGGNMARNTTIIRSNYLWDESAAMYEHALKLWETLAEELDYDVLFSQRGVLNLAHNLQFPYDQRWLLVAWRALFFRPGVYQTNATQDERWNRGAYLVQGLGHCGACHTPRNAPRSDGRFPIWTWTNSAG